MRFIKVILNTALLFSILTGFASCEGQSQKTVESKSEPMVSKTIGDTVSEIGKNMRCIFQDSNNNFWFATNGDGVFKHDGKTLLQFTDKHGLPNKFVWYVYESKDGIIWLKTSDGVCSFDGKQFSTKQTDENISEVKDIISADLFVEYYYDGKTLKKFCCHELLRLQTITIIIHLIWYIAHTKTAMGIFGWELTAEAFANMTAGHSLGLSTKS